MYTNLVLHSSRSGRDIETFGKEMQGNKASAVAEKILIFWITK